MSDNNNSQVSSIEANKGDVFYVTVFPPAQQLFITTTVSIYGVKCARKELEEMVKQGRDINWSQEAKKIFEQGGKL